MPQAGCNLSDMHDVVVGDAELVAATTGLDVVVRRLESDFRIHAQRYSRAQPALAGQPIDRTDFCFALGVDEQDVRVERFAEFAVRLANAPEDNVGRLKPGGECAMQLAAGHDIYPRAERAEHVEYAAARVGLERIVNSM